MFVCVHACAECRVLQTSGRATQQQRVASRAVCVCLCLRPRDLNRFSKQVCVHRARSAAAAPPHVLQGTAVAGGNLHSFYGFLASIVALLVIAGCLGYAAVRDVNAPTPLAAKR